VIRVGIGEEQVELSRAELGRDRGLLFRDLLGQLRIARGELVELDQVAGAFFELLPSLDELPVLGAFSRERARPRPRVGSGGDRSPQRA
jgi:hypothetical protein